MTNKLTIDHIKNLRDLEKLEKQLGYYKSFARTGTDPVKPKAEPKTVIKQWNGREMEVK